jgi:hypothetical protein
MKKRGPQVEHEDVLRSGRWTRIFRLKGRKAPFRWQPLSWSSPLEYLGFLDEKGLLPAGLYEFAKRKYGPKGGRVEP